MNMMRTISSKAFRSESLSTTSADDDVESEGDAKSGDDEESDDDVEFSDGGESDDDGDPNSAAGKSSAPGCCSGVVSLGSVGDEELDDSASLFSCAAFNCTPLVVAFRKS